MIADRRPTVIVGVPEEVKAALTRARDDGRLVAVHGAARLPNGRVRVTAQLAAPAAAPRPWTGPAITAGIVLAGVAVAAGLVWAVVVIVAAVVAWVTAHLPWLIAAAVVLVGLLVTSGGRVHCPGCPR